MLRFSIELKHRWNRTLSKDMLEITTSNEDLIFTETEVADMAAALVGKFGEQAINLAAFFLDEHLEQNDRIRAEVWLRVTSHLDQYYDQSISDMVN